MTEVDQPDGERAEGRSSAERTKSAEASPTSEARRVFGGGLDQDATAPAIPPGEVADRLASLEGRIEEAFAGSGSGARPGGERLRAAVDGLLATLAGARRLTVPEPLAALRSFGQPLPIDDPANLSAVVLRAVYRYWWRVDAIGLERVPETGPVLLAVNRSGALLPYEALMVAIALAIDHPARRLARPLVDAWSLRLPGVGSSLSQAGALPVTATNMRRLLEQGEAVVVLPEGARAVAKPFRRRYRLARFGGGAFARVAITTGTPIVPAAVIGAEEVQPVLGRVDGLGRLLGLPTLPVTPTFPWLGLVGLLPLPTKWTVLIGEPLDVAARHDPADAGGAAVRAVSEQVRERLQALVLEGLRRRRSVFRG